MPIVNPSIHRDIPVDHDTKEIQEPLKFHLPREASFFIDQAETDPLVDDHDYFRKRQSIEMCHYIAHGLIEVMSYRVFSFENVFLEFFGNASDSRYVSGIDVAAGLRKIAVNLEQKLTKQVEAAKLRAPTPFVPTIERIIQKMGQPEEENRLFRFLCIFQVGPFYDVSNSKFLIGREGRFQPNRNSFRHGTCETFCPATLLCNLFQEQGYLLHKVLPMFRQSSKWVTERLLPACVDPSDNTCNFNDAMRLVVLGVGLGPTQYHALESNLVQQALGEDPSFLASEAGKAHLALKGGPLLAGSTRGANSHGSAAEEGMGNREDSVPVGGMQNKLREALQKRDRSKKESVFDVLTMMRHNSAEAKTPLEEGSNAGAASGDLFPAGSNEEGDFKGMMQKAPSAVFDSTDNVEGEAAAVANKKIPKSGEDQEEASDDSKMKQPYKNDLEYLEDQFQLLNREKTVVRTKAHLHEAVQSGKDGETGGNDAEFDPMWGGRRPGVSTVDTGKIEGDLRKAKTRLTIHGELCKARLRSTSGTSVWYPRLEILSDALELSRFEKLVVLDLIKSIISPDRDPHRHPSFGSRRELSISSLQEKFCSTLEERMACRKSFYKSGVLIREGIIFVSDADFMEDLSQMQVDIDRRMLDFLIGLDSEVAEIVDGSHLYVPNVDIDSVVLPAADKKRIMEVVMNFEATKRKREEYGMEEKYSKGFGSVILAYGKPGTGKTLMANAVAKSLKRKVLLVNFPALGANSAGKIIQFLFREAKINKAVLFFDECEALFMTRDRGNTQINQLLTEIERSSELVILATNRQTEIDEAMFRRINLAIEFKEPDHILREEIWRTLRPEKLPLDDKVDFAELAMKYELTGGFIKNCWIGALGLMIANKQDKVYQRDLEKAASEQIVGRLSMSDFDKKVVPTCGLDSIVVTEAIHDSLKDIINFSKAQNVLMGQWGFAKKHNTNRGISVLLTGDSGCGKTLTASVIGYELGKPLKMVNAAELMSKWVGETAKNIEAVFASAKNEDAVLVFDEAEGIFGARDSDASRHDTVNVGVLLQHIENFKGICVVITNLKDRIDSAFFRRFRFILNFEKPDPKLRKRLWRTIVPEECPVSADVNYDVLADRYETTGGQIKQIVLRAATRAALRSEPEKRKLFMADLEKSCKEEEDKSGNKGTSAGMYL